MDCVELIKEYRETTDLERKELIQESIISENEGLIYSVVNKFNTNFLDKEDLFQEAAIALIKSLSTYDLNKKIKFQTYAYKVMENSIKREIKKAENDIRVPEYISTMLNKIKDIEEEYKDKYSRLPSNKEIATILNIKEEKVKELKHTAFLSLGLSHIHDDDLNKSIIDVISLTKNSKEDDNELLYEALETLSPKNKDIMELYFGLNDKSKTSINDLAIKYGVTIERIRQIIRESQRKIKHYMEDNKADE